ncbi:MAG TPA: hypothetical protein VFW26_01260 [Gaiellales bacterium]|nr:hypothetical protein [Gaiellales bacterium]
MASSRITIEHEIDLKAGERRAPGRAGALQDSLQRYLSELARQGAVQLRLHYGAAGRPEHRYRIASDLE